MAGKIRPIHQYPETALVAALTPIRDGIGVRKASRQFQVPRGTIQDRVHGRVKETARRMGPPTLAMTKNKKLLPV